MTIMVEVRYSYNVLDQFSWLIRTKTLHLALGFFQEQKRAEAEKRQLGTIKLQRHPYIAIFNGSLLVDLGARDFCGWESELHARACIGEEFGAKQGVCLLGSYKHSKDAWIGDVSEAREVFSTSAIVLDSTRCSEVTLKRISSYGIHSNSND